MPYGHASFEHVAHAVATLFQEHAETTEQALVEAYRIPDAATGIAVSLERPARMTSAPAARAR